MAMKRRTEIKLDIHRRTTLYSRQVALREWCTTCGTQSVWLTPEGVAATTPLRARQVYQYAETGQAVFTESAQGTLFVCLSCLDQFIQAAQAINQALDQLATSPVGPTPPVGPSPRLAFDKSAPSFGVTNNPLHSLLHWLDPDQSRAAEQYLHIHQRLALYFQKLYPTQATDLADEVLQRVSRQVECNSDGITLFRGSNSLSYCYGVARNLLRELGRRAKRFPMIPLEDATLTFTLAVPAEETQAIEHERRLAALERALGALTPEQRTLVLQYYQREGRDRTQARRLLAAQLGITENALRIRLCHIRRQLAEQLQATASLDC
jgi:RNA polymerase sigma factor (sigma-70 family)